MGQLLSSLALPAEAATREDGLIRVAKEIDEQLLMVKQQKLHRRLALGISPKASLASDLLIMLQDGDKAYYDLFQKETDLQLYLYDQKCFMRELDSISSTDRNIANFQSDEGIYNSSRFLQPGGTDQVIEVIEAIDADLNRADGCDNRKADTFSDSGYASSIPAPDTGQKPRERSKMVATNPTMEDLAGLATS